MSRLERALVRSVGAAAIAWCLSFPALAAPAQPPAKPASPVSSLPENANDDPAKVAAARAFLMAYRPNLDPAIASAQIDRIMPRLIAGQKRLNPKLDTVKYEKDTRARMMAMTLEGLDLQSHVVSRHFTIQELKDLTAFFSGAVGKKLISETPKIAQEMRVIRRTNPRGSLAGDDSSDGQAAPPAQKKK